MNLIRGYSFFVFVYVVFAASTGAAEGPDDRWFEDHTSGRRSTRRPINRRLEGSGPQESDSGIRGPRFAEVEQELKDLSAKHTAVASYASYGKTKQGRNLSVIRIGLPGRRVETAPAILLTGATHGDEYLNVEDQMPRIFLANARESGTGLNNFLKKGGMIYIVPIFNPDGYENRQRENSNGVDLNRDFDIIPLKEPKFTQVETKSWIEFLDKDLAEKNLSLKMSMDYHCCGGAWLYPWGYTKEPLKEPAVGQHKEWAKGFLNLFGSGYKMGTTWAIFGYLSHGTSRDYYFAKYGSLSYTFEGAYKTENQNVAKHTTMWDQILNHFSGAAQ
jgi:carboxypeptidase T